MVQFLRICLGMWLLGAWIVPTADAAAFRSGFESVYFNEPIEKQGFWVEGRCWFYPNGNLKSATLAKRATFMGNEFPKSTQIELTEDKLLLFCILPYDMLFQGIPVRGGSSDWLIQFFPGNGRIRSAWLSKDVMIDSIPCAKATVIGDLFLRGGSMGFHSSGKLRTTRLSRDLLLQGIKFKTGDRIYINTKGKVFKGE